jgi:hypothetical protein
MSVEKCVAIDRKIEHYERLCLSITDQITIDRIKALVQRLRPRRPTFIRTNNPKAGIKFQLCTLVHLHSGGNIPNCVSSPLRNVAAIGD